MEGNASTNNLLSLRDDGLLPAHIVADGDLITHNLAQKIFPPGAQKSQQDKDKPMSKSQEGEASQEGQESYEGHEGKQGPKPWSDEGDEDYEGVQTSTCSNHIGMSFH